MNEIERAEAVSHCRYVDQVIIDSPWIVTLDFINLHQIDYVTHGEDDSYDEDGNDCYKFVKDIGRFMTIKRTDGISTSDLIMRIVKDYDAYVRRNLSRGFSAKDLNISFFKETQLQMEKTYEDLSNSVSVSVTIVGDNIQDRTEGFMHFIKKNGKIWLKI